MPARPLRPRGPLSALAGPDRRRLIGRWVLALLGLSAIMARSEVALRRSGGGIVAFELAGTPERAAALLESWGAEGRAAARESLVLDQGYLVAYSSVLALAATEAGVAFGDRGWRRTARLAGPLGWAQYVAAGCDAVENAALFAVVGGSTRTGLPALARRAALVKFALIALGLPYGLVGLVVGHRARRAAG